MNQKYPMVMVYIIVASAFVGLSMPFPVFSHLFLSAESTLFSPEDNAELRGLLLGLAISLFPIGQIVGANVWGNLSDRLGRKLALSGSLLVAFLGMILVAISIEFSLIWGLLLGRVISGFGEGNIAIAQAIAADSADEKVQAKSFAGISIAINVGWIIGPLLGGILADKSLISFASWSLPFWVASLIYLANLLLVPYLPEQPVVQQPSRVVNPQQKPASIVSLVPQFWPKMVLSFIAFFAVYTMFSYYIPYLVKEFHFSVAQAGIYSALFSVPLIIAGMICHKVQAQLGSRGVMLLSIGLLSIGLAGFGLATNMVWIIIFTCVVSFGIVFSEVATAIIVAKGVEKQHNGKVMGSYRAVTVASEILASFLGGILLAIYSPSVFWFAALAVLVGLFTLFGRFRVG